MKAIATFLSPLLLCCAGLFLAACGDDAAVSASAGGARVNGRPILAAATAEGSAGSAAARAALDRLIDQQLLADQAVQQRLDRDPAVAAELERTRRRILAQAYVDRHMLGRTPSEEELVLYYESHAPLFGQRRIYRYEELVLATPGPPLPELQARLAQPGTFEDIAVWLAAHGIAFRRSGGIRAAEQLPAALLPRLAALDEGQIVLLEGEAGRSIVRLLQAQPAPLSLAEARPEIERLIAEQARATFARARARQLRDKAEIEYLGPFADGELAARTSLRSPKAANRDEEHIARGLAGLL